MITIKNIQIKKILEVLLKLQLDYDSIDLILDEENNRIIIDTTSCPLNDYPPEINGEINNLDEII